MLGCGLLDTPPVNQISVGWRRDGDLQWLAARFRAKMEGDRGASAYISYLVMRARRVRLYDT
jgi:hypothetical protein